MLLNGPDNPRKLLFPLGDCILSWAQSSLRPKQLLDRFSRFCTAHRRVSHYFTMGRYVFHPKLSLRLGDRVPHLTHSTYGHLSHYPKRHLDRFSRFRMSPKCSAVQCIVNGKQNPKNCPFPLRFRHPAGGGRSHGHRQHAPKLW